MCGLVIHLFHDDLIQKHNALDEDTRAINNENIHHQYVEEQ
jgi:hypothetical protein